MSAATDSRAEVAKLARLLGLDGADSLQELLEVPAAELLDYRDRVTALLHDDDQKLLRRMAKAAPLLPTQMLATIGERALGPLICARLVELVSTELAVQIGQLLSTDFLAELAAALDPRRSGDVLAMLPRHRLAAVAVAMGARGEHVAMGRIAGQLDDEALAVCIDQLSDEDLLRVAFVIEGTHRLAYLGEIAGVERLQRVLDSSVSLGLHHEAVGLLEHLDAGQREQLQVGPIKAKRGASAVRPPIKPATGHVAARASGKRPPRSAALSR